MLLGELLAVVKEQLFTSVDITESNEFDPMFAVY